MESYKPLSILNAEQQRVLGALMEKSRTTPEYYPMTINALVAACNQKTSRKPVVQYNEETITLTLDSLKKLGLISTATGGSSRAIKYKHNFAIVYPVVPAEVALICLLLLRGAQTPGELNTNSGRLFEFETLDEVNEVLEKLSSSETPFVKQLPRKAGQKETRYMHLLGGEQFVEDDEVHESTRKTNNELESRVTKLETDLAELRDAFDKLMKELT